MSDPGSDEAANEAANEAPLDPASSEARNRGTVMMTSEQLAALRGNPGGAATEEERSEDTAPDTDTPDVVDGADVADVADVADGADGAEAPEAAPVSDEQPHAPAGAAHDPASAESRNRGTVMMSPEQLAALRANPNTAPATPAAETPAAPFAEAPAPPAYDPASAENRTRGTVAMRPADLASAGLGGTAAPAEPATTPAGWYPDPHNPGQQRYWDGSHWAEPGAGPGAASVPPPYTGSMPGGAPEPPKKKGFFARLFGRD